MPLNDREDIKKQIFDRILTTISRQKRKKRLLRGAILFFVLSICSTSLYIFYPRSINISPQKSEHIYADITAGDITISGSRPMSLAEWENNKNKPFFKYIIFRFPHLNILFMFFCISKRRRKNVD